jgi:predicted component of type VI protein secretion system
MSEFTFIEQSPSEGAEHAVQQGTTIGREGCDITLGDPDVSRRHAEIQISNGDIAINDLGSTNGTFVNGERIDQPRTLRDGDEVRIGAVVLRLSAPAGATRLAGTIDAGVATPSQPTTLRQAEPAPEPAAQEPPTAPQPAASEPAAPAPQPAASEPAAPAPAEPATPAAPEPAAPEPAAPVAAADQPTAHSPAPAPPRGASRGDVPIPDFAPSAIRRVVPADAPTAFTPDEQGSRRGGSAATRGGATLFSTIVIAATTAGVLIYYITEPFK